MKLSISFVAPLTFSPEHGFGPMSKVALIRTKRRKINERNEVWLDVFLNSEESSHPGNKGLTEKRKSGSAQGGSLRGGIRWKEHLVKRYPIHAA